MDKSLFIRVICKNKKSIESWTVKYKNVSRNVNTSITVLAAVAVAATKGSNVVIGRVGTIRENTLNEQMN